LGARRERDRRRHLGRSSQFPVGSNWPWHEPAVAAIAKQARAGVAVRIDDLGQVPGTVADAGGDVRIGAAAAAPIVVDGESWGMIGFGTAKGAPLPDRIEERLAEFTELVAVAIASSANREQLTRLAAEQAALRRVATFVARGAPPADVFEAVAEELGRLLDVGSSGMVRLRELARGHDRRPARAGPGRHPGRHARLARG
jgi:GAF domain-containing protein